MKKGEDRRKGKRERQVRDQSARGIHKPQRKVKQLKSTREAWPPAATKRGNLNGGGGSQNFKINNGRGAREPLSRETDAANYRTLNGEPTPNFPTHKSVGSLREKRVEFLGRSSDRLVFQEPPCFNNPKSRLGDR